MRAGCLTVLGKPLPYGRGSATAALISQGLPSRDRQGAVFVSQESPKWLSTHACGHVPQVECAAPFNAALLKYLGEAGGAGGAR